MGNDNPDDGDDDDDEKYKRYADRSVTLVGAIELIGAIRALPVTIALLVPCESNLIFNIRGEDINININ